MGKCSRIHRTELESLVGKRSVQQTEPELLLVGQRSKFPRMVVELKSR